MGTEQQDLLRKAKEDIGITDHVSMRLDITLKAKDYIHPRDYLKEIRHDFIEVPIIFQPELEIPIQLSLTQDDIFYLESFKKDSQAERRQLISRYYFVMRYTTTKIGKMLGVSDVTVGNEVKRIRKLFIGKINRDLRTNNKVLGHMVELMVQINERVKIMWDKYYQLESDSMLLRDSVREIKDALKGEPDMALLAAKNINNMMAQVFSIHKEQQNYLGLLRQETKQMLEVWEKFGLTGEEAVKVILSGKVNVDFKIEEVRINIVRMIGIIKAEVTDQNLQSKVFNRMSNELKFSNMKRVN